MFCKWFILNVTTVKKTLSLYNN